METIILGNDFFAFYKFPLPSTLLLPPCSTAVPASLLSMSRMVHVRYIATARYAGLFSKLVLE